MSPLAFDKQGKPFGWSRGTRQLRVRVFKNPSARGTCCQVHDGEGNPLYIDCETDFMTFRKAVGHAPGLYRLDQCDQDGIEIDDAQPAYVSIDLSRNASFSGEGDPNPMAIMEHMFAIHADVMKTMAAQQASLMAATAEILRAPIRAPLPAAEPKKEIEDEEEDEDDDRNDEDEDEQDEEPEDPWAAWRPYLKMVEPHLPKIGAFLYQQFSTYLTPNATPPPAAAPTPVSPAPPTVSSSPAASSAEYGPVSAAAGSAVPAPTVVATTAPAATMPTAASVTTDAVMPSMSTAHVAPSVTPTTTTTTDAGADASTTTTAPSVASASEPSTITETPRNAMPIPMPTPEQWQHLHAIRERLKKSERAIAENAIARMSGQMLNDWLAQMSTMPVEDAVQMIRDMIAKGRLACTERS